MRCQLCYRSRYDDDRRPPSPAAASLVVRRSDRRGPLVTVHVAVRHTAVRFAAAGPVRSAVSARFRAARSSLDVRSDRPRAVAVSYATGTVPVSNATRTVAVSSATGAGCCRAVVQRQSPMGRLGRQMRRAQEHDGLRAQPVVQLCRPHVRLRLEHYRRVKVHEELQRLRVRVPKRYGYRGSWFLQGVQNHRSGKSS